MWRRSHPILRLGFVCAGLLASGGAVDEVLDLDVANDSERGLLGIELHPDFAHNGFV